MEIKNSLLKEAYSYRSKIDGKADAAGNRARSADEAAPAPAFGDRVSFSPSALMHTMAHAVASRTAEVRQEKIDNVKERLSSGEYAVDSRQIAQKLLETEALLAGTLDQDTL
jgi:negative regulator of flagellin synthesis FlgM